MSDLSKGKFTSRQLKRLDAMGWQMCMTGPNEWEWLKFSRRGGVMAHGGDAVWKSNLEALEHDRV